MKLETSASSVQEVFQESNDIRFPEGLIGLPELQRMQIVFVEEELPFLHLKEVGEKEELLEFLVIEPQGVIENYTVEISDKDQKFLELESAEDVMILNIATFHPGEKVRVTTNLMGPLVINRKTHKGKQVIIENYNQYSAEHVLHEEK